MRPSPHRTLFSWLLGLGVVAASAIAETSAASRLEVGVCLDDVDTCISASHVGLRPDGLWIRSVHAYRGAHEVSLESLRVHVDGVRGIWFEARGMSGVLVAVDDAPPAVAKYHAEKSARARAPTEPVEERPPPQTEREGEAAALGRLLAPMRKAAARVGLPVSASVDGELKITLGHHASMIAQRVDATVSPEGSARARIEGEARIAQDTVARTSALLFTSTAEAGTLMRSEVDMAGARLRVDGRVRGRELQVRVTDDRDGRLQLSLPSLRTPRNFSIESEDFRVPAGLGALARLVAPRVRLDVETTRISGAVKVALGKDNATVTLDDFGVDGLTVRSDALAREPVTLGPWRASGVLERSDRARAAKVVLAHGDVRFHLDAAWSPQHAHIDAELEETSCEELLRAIPPAMSNVVRGATLEGRLGGRARLHFDRESLTRVGEIEDRTGIPQPDPGLLEFDLPIERACAVTSLPPEIDVAALARPYVHRFHDGDRALRRKIFDTSDDGFVALGQVRSLGHAFVALEDLNFKRHSGFDREQIRRAVWHNLTERRFSRGASTITQQTARNLWLGIDRSLGRKLQEALLTRELEEHLTKERILEIYINIIELGPGVYGVKEAAEFYFGRAPEQLNLLERIHLASLAPAPSAYSKKWRAGAVDDTWMQTLRRHVRRMRRMGYISHAQAAAAARSPLRLLDRTPKDATRSTAPSDAGAANSEVVDPEVATPPPSVAGESTDGATSRQATRPSLRGAAAP